MSTDPIKTPSGAQLLAQNGSKHRTWQAHWLALVLLSLFWLLLTDFRFDSALIGLPTIALALWLSRSLRNDQPHPLSFGGLIRFVPFFIWESLLGGWTVARRTCAPQLHVDPGFICFTTRLRRHDAQRLFVNCINLLPGTLAAGIHNRQIHVHLLSMDLDPTDELRRLEQAVSRVLPEPEDAA